MSVAPIQLEEVSEEETVKSLQIKNKDVESLRGERDRQGPETFCCSAAGLAPGQTSPQATKYQETKKDWGQLWKNEIQKAPKPNFHF